ncbi:Acyl-CoA synthetase short-chain family member 3 [Phytophthora cinnamomi]|uniref:Acyl-CoA synthetase short-chain family member 3 n=1 Tax=Phytophthora cinnamomi TaxID=4785 RepID=UPI0035595D5B|nr:Acyl-CoA synthetase short-chain family member 3 [Phytophthora cinnamomi]
MTTTDAAFLAEVDDFLVSFDLPTFPTLRTLTSDEDSDEASSTDAVPTVQNAPKSQASSVGSRGTKKQPLCNAEAAAKLEMDRAKDRKRRSAYRERRRVEKETLQQQVGDLSTELLNLQKARQAERSLASSAWEMVSKRQLQARLNAEEKQRRLIQAVESHASAIEDLKGLHDRLCIADDTIAHSIPSKAATALVSSARATSSHDLQTVSTKTLARSDHPGMLRLEYLRKMLLYALLCLLAKALAANPCFGFAMQYCQLRMPNALVVFAKAFRWSKQSEALFFSFI